MASTGLEDDTPENNPAPQVNPETVPAIEEEAVTAGSPVLLPVSVLLDKFDKLKTNRRRQWKPETAKNVGVVVRMFVDIPTKSDVEHCGQNRQAHLAALRDYFGLVPTNYGQSVRLRAMSVPEHKPGNSIIRRSRLGERSRMKRTLH